MADGLGVDLEARKEAQRAAIARCAGGGVRVKATRNLTAFIDAKVRAQRENRELTAAEIALCDDLTVEPVNPGSAT